MSYEDRQKASVTLPKQTARVIGQKASDMVQFKREITHKHTGPAVRETIADGLKKTEAQCTTAPRPSKGTRFTLQEKQYHPSPCAKAFL